MYDYDYYTLTYSPIEVEQGDSKSPYLPVCKGKKVA